MSAQRATDISEDDRRAGDEAIAECRRIQAQIQARNPDMTQEDRDELADRWAEDVNEAIRDQVIRQREEAAARRS